MNWADALRREIRKCAEEYAEQHELSRYHSLGRSPTVMFEAYAGGTLHGNFLAGSYKAILDYPPWRARLLKPHQRPDALPARTGREAMELDSSNSSDALLMNIFCYPAITRSVSLAQLFGRRTLPSPEFGVPGCVPLKGGEPDATEIDMRLGKSFVEAKLTEANFTAKMKAHVETYRDFDRVFDSATLPQSDEEYSDYQLIRNVLAASAHEAEFYLICDARRPDLLRSWWEVMRSIKSPALRSRCHFVLWQEIAASVPEGVREFLLEKYGIATDTWDSGVVRSRVR